MVAAANEPVPLVEAVEAVAVLGSLQPVPLAAAVEVVAVPGAA